MNNPHYRRLHRTSEIYAWAEAMPIERKPPRLKARPTIDAKLTKVASMVTRWQTKVKRATTALKKWQRKERYYTKLVAMQRPPQGEEGRGSCKVLIHGGDIRPFQPQSCFSLLASGAFSVVNIAAIRSIDFAA
jgi:hypothetical protein